MSAAGGLLPVAVGVPVGLAAPYGISLAAACIHPHLPARPPKPAETPERKVPVAQPRDTAPYEAGAATVGSPDINRYQGVAP